MSVKQGEISTKPGTIYFIRERDFITNDVSPFVKIGLTALDRSAAERKDDLKTGNPRELFVHHEVQVPCVSAVETALRYEFILQNVNLEWHYFGANSKRRLEEAIAYCEELGKTFAGYSDVIDEARRLNDVPSNENLIARTAESDHWWRQYLIHHHVTSIVKVAKLARAEEAKELVSRGFDAPTGVLVGTQTRPSFDEDGFRAKYPSIYEQHVVRKFKATFNSKGKLTADELNAVDLVSSARNAYDAYVASANDTESNDAYSSSHRKFLTLQQLTKFSEVEKEVAKSHLKVLCGEAGGIEGTCTWQRGPGSPKLDITSLKAAHGDLVAEFTTEVQVQVARTQKGAGGLAGDDEDDNS